MRSKGAVAIADAVKGLHKLKVLLSCCSALNLFENPLRPIPGFLSILLPLLIILKWDSLQCRLCTHNWKAISCIVNQRHCHIQLGVFYVGMYQ